MRIVVISDVHWAGAAEKARRGWESRIISSPALRWLVSCYRRFFWLADPTAHNHRLDAVLARAGQPDLVVANGDYSCDSGFVGLADDAAFASAQECLSRLRGAFGGRLLATLGDHELGKMSLFGGAGGLRLASWRRATEELGLEPLWVRDSGSFVLIGLTSSLIALPAFQPEMLDGEREAWRALREAHLADLRRAFTEIPAGRRIILFCHDPTALPYLGQEEWMRERLPDLECTVIGHLHSPFILGTSRCLTGIPELSFLGNTARRLSGALRRARAWAPFRIVLCPSPAGIQLLKDGGYLELQAGGDAMSGLRAIRHRVPWQ